MNENIDLTKILKNTPKGTKLYSPLFGVVSLSCIETGKNIHFPISVINSKSAKVCFTADGKYYNNFKESKCLLFPSKDQKDWAKFDTIRIGEPCMVQNRPDRDFIVRYYAGNGQVFNDGLKEGPTCTPYRIIRVEDFDFDDLLSNE